MFSKAFFTGCVLLLATIPWNNAFLLDDNKFALKVAAFNVQRFGETKTSNAVVIDQLVQIVSRYDLVLIQEVQDHTLQFMNKFLAELQKGDSSWTYNSSQPLGRNSYTEQYVFFYRTTAIKLESTYQVLDPKDIYQREPYAIKVQYFSTEKSELRHVILAGLHSSPHSVKAELMELENSMKFLDVHWPKTDGVIAMGDFNADCRYLAKIHRTALNIFTTTEFRSLIQDEVDTTVRTSDCAYDRIIVYGSQIDAREAMVYDFQADMNLNQTEAELVSDHYPIEFKLY